MIRYFHTGMGGGTIFAIQVVLMALAFLVTTSPVPLEDPDLTLCWCQQLYTAQKSTPETDARTRECCKQADKSFNAFMNLTYIESSTGEIDKDEKDIVLKEMKPSCFTKSRDMKFCQTFGSCCISANMSLRGDGPGRNSMDPDD